MNEEKVLQSVLGTSRSWVGTEGTERGHVFCRVTEPGANQILRKLSLRGIRVKQETFSCCEEAGPEGSSLSVPSFTSAQESCRQRSVSFPDLTLQAAPFPFSGPRVVTLQ